MSIKAILAGGAALFLTLQAQETTAQSVRVVLAETNTRLAYDGRVMLIFSKDGSTEPRFQVERGFQSAQIFGIDAENLKAGEGVRFEQNVIGYPLRSLSDIPAGEYYVQAVLNRYDEFRLGNGKVVRLPASRGAGQNWRKEPGNLFSQSIKISYDPNIEQEISLKLTHVMPDIPLAPDTEFIRKFKFRSASLSQFWGKDVFLTGHVLVPKDFDQHPEARYPIAIFHGHHPETFGGFQTTPPDPNLICKPSARFQNPCYNRTEQQEAYDFYRQWVSEDFPRFLIVEIDHSNPYFDDSYAVNSANLGPYGDAINREFLPALERKFRGLGQGWARFLYGGSTGGWIALANQIFYPDMYNGAFAACPDSVDFRQTKVINIYEDDNAFWRIGPFGRVERAVHQNYLGHVGWTNEMENRYERVLGSKSRSGGQWDIWDAVHSPMGEDGYPRPIWNKETGVIDKEVAAHWRENFDLRHILERDWASLRPKLRGKLHIYVGDMDNFHLNNAVYLMENFLKTTDYGGEVKYGDRAEHCWNGDPRLPNKISRLRYNSMYVPKMMQRMQETAPKGADLSSWRYK